MAKILALAVLTLLIYRFDAKLFRVPKSLPAKMSSLYSANVKPELANDGNTDGNYIDGVQCIHNGVDSLPWWMLDMMETYLIASARIWNRLDGPTAPRFRQMSVGVSSDPSVWTTFNPSRFQLCAYWSKVPTVADNPINFACSGPITGRYLAVYKNITGVDGYLHFCEIDIFAVTRESDSQFEVTKIHPSFSASSTSLLSASSNARSEINCMLRCSEQPACFYVLFNAASLECWLFKSASIPSSFISDLSSGAAEFYGLYGLA